MFASPDVGGIAHPPEVVHSHDMSIGPLLTESATLDVSAQIRDALHVEVRLTNDRTGHHLPTGTPLRHLILVVTAKDDQGQTLRHLAGSTNPAWTGGFAGTSGKTYARVLEDVWLGDSPTAAYWNRTRLVSDNRLAAGARDISRFRFAVPTAGRAELTVRLWYRRAFADLSRQKGWAGNDTLMEEATHLVYPAIKSQNRR